MGLPESIRGNGDESCGVKELMTSTIVKAGIAIMWWITNK